MNREVSLPDGWIGQPDTDALAHHRHPLTGEEVSVRYSLDRRTDALQQKPVEVWYAVPSGDDAVEYGERFSTLGDAKRFLGHAGIDVEVEPYEHLDVRGNMERVAYADYLTGEEIPAPDVPPQVASRRQGTAPVAADGGKDYAFPEPVTVHRLHPLNGAGAPDTDYGSALTAWNGHHYLVTVDGGAAPPAAVPGSLLAPVTADDIDGEYTSDNGHTRDGAEGFAEKLWDEEQFHLPVQEQATGDAAEQKEI